MRRTTNQRLSVERDEFRELVDERIRRFFDMTLDQFARAYQAGELDQRPIAADLALLAGVGAREE